MTKKLKIPRKPRTQLRASDPMVKSIPQEFRNCDAPGCPNIISTDKVKGDSKPVYCILHSGAKK